MGASGNEIRVILADDHALLRQGTAELLNREPDILVVGEAENGQQAVELARELRPDVVIMDVRMPVLSGIEATRIIREAAPRVHVLVLTAHEDDQYVFSLLQAGARGYLLKNSPVSELVRAIREISHGESPLDPKIAHKLVTRLSGSAPRASVQDGEGVLVEDLTPREFEVLRLLAQGLSNRAIAESLVISERTVQTHLSSVFDKMGVTSRVEAVLSAIRRGWLTLE
jgi:NarL family two-component system response regulator LiaR